MMNDKCFDLIVIGGGINGMGIARDAVGRGLSVLLLEKGDFASATSSASTKIVHGGLRYLEYYEFGLVRSALQEREILLKMAPHIIWPLEFILPHRPDMRPAWLVRLGLFLYDHLGKREILPKSKMISIDHSKLQDKHKKGFSYADCWVDDSRLVILNALDAKERGAYIYNYMPCTDISCIGGEWIVTAGNDDAGYKFKGKAIVNAAGPWVRSLLDDNNLSKKDTHAIRLVKGSHIITKRLFEGDEAYILQQDDGRIVFVIPYEDEYSLIGTTDVEYSGDASQCQIDPEEVDYLCKAVNAYIRKPISKDDVVSTYSGVRALLDSGEDNASAVTRDYLLEYTEDHGAPLLSIFGGKITTYRVLAEKALSYLTDKPAWTKASTLAGASLGYNDSDTLFKDLKLHAEDVNEGVLKALSKRWARQYGARSEEILSSGQLGTNFGHGLYQAEVDYLLENEFVKTAEDILKRRTKLRLKFTKTEAEELETYVQGKMEGRLNDKAGTTSN